MNALRKIMLIALEEHKIAWRSRRMIGVTLFIALASIVLLIIYSNIPRTLMIMIINYLLQKNLSFAPASADLMQAQVDLFFSMSNVVISSVLLFAALLLGYDSISSGRQTNSLRFILSKVDRRIYLIGKFLSLMLYLLIILLVIYLMVLLYVFFRIGTFEIVNVLISIIFFMVYIGSWLSIFTLVSTISRKSSLFIALLVPLLFVLLFLSRFSLFSPFSYLSINMSQLLLNSAFLLPFLVIPLVLASVIIEVIDL